MNTKEIVISLLEDEKAYHRSLFILTNDNTTRDVIKPNKNDQDAQMMVELYPLVKVAYAIHMINHIRHPELINNDFIRFQKNIEINGLLLFSKDRNYILFLFAEIFLGIVIASYANLFLGIIIIVLALLLTDYLSCKYKAHKFINEVSLVLKVSSNDKSVYGEGRKTNIASLIKQYELEIKKGSSRAMFNLANLYKSGKDVEKNIQRAIELYEQAIELGNLNAINMLGFLYQKGEDVEKDMQKAIELYKQASIMGYTIAMYNLANLYAEGDGVEKNISTAIKLYKHAYVRGDQMAQYNLVLLGVSIEDVEDIEDLEDIVKILREI